MAGRILGLALVGLASQALGQASETVTVGVTIPVTVPLQVPPGKSFQEAAKEFVARNNLDASNVPQIEQALVQRWDEMRAQNMNKERCLTLQMEHNVFPTKSFGTLPAESRVDWLKMECDSLVPASPPQTIESLDVVVDDTTLLLRAFEGETVRSAVERFCTSYGISFEENGQALMDAFTNKITSAQQKQTQQEVDPLIGTFLFAIPITVDDRTVDLRVHEGDNVASLVQSFCEQNNLSQEQHGETIRAAIVQTAEQVRQRLVEQASQQKEQKQAPAEPQLLMDIPINVDGADVSMKLYDGDYVDQKISQFCSEHGLDESTHGKVLLQHIAERTQALSQQ